MEHKPYSVIPVILSGGSGSRLWPLSRSTRPKQFIRLIDRQKSLFQLTLDRISKLANVENALVVSNVEHRFAVGEQIQESNTNVKFSILLEPCAKNTAPAIASAAHYVLSTLNLKNSILLILPADHVIKNLENFVSSVETACVSAASGHLVTFGIKPNYPATGYGYLRSKKANNGAISVVDSYVEKPDLKTATQYVNSGEYFWNSGIFLFSAQQYLDELETTYPDMVVNTARAVKRSSIDVDFVRLEKNAYDDCENDSIDYAVMEKSNNVRMLTPDIQWNDVGSWSSVWEISDKDASGNVCVGDVWTHNAKNCYLHADNRMIAAIGVKDIVIIETRDGVMVTQKSSDQDVKKVVAQLIEAKRPEALVPRKVYRPWGNYDCVDAGKGFQVKRITVTPGEALSLQKHHHRAEHWIVVSGTAEVTKNEDVYLLKENESTYIPMGAIHKLRNPGKVPLEIIEVQSGSILSEDDIVRLEDNYGRANKEA